MVNLIDKEPETAAAFDKKALAFIKGKKDRMKSSEITDKEHIEKLKALGYIQ